jgi:hypothetical protein
MAAAHWRSTDALGCRFMMLITVTGEHRLKAAPSLG